jgi:cell division protein ZapA
VASFTVKILGDEYQIRSEDPPEHVQRVASFVDAKMREISSGSSTLSPGRVAILAALNISDEFLRFREGVEEDRRRLDLILENLIALIDRTVPPSG